jgi:hypothetical protein
MGFPHDYSILSILPIPPIPHPTTPLKGEGQNAGITGSK